MLEYICTQCGGRVEVQDGARIGKCKACQSLFILPNQFAQKQNLYQIAVNARLAGNFQAAARDYAKILKIDAKETEAHWGYLLSKFGITLTQDQQIYFSRLETSSLIGDPSYEMMIRYCPEEALYYYQGLSARIEDKHKRLLEIARNVGEYDIFIDCTAPQSSTDYLLANQLGQALDEAGYRVFLPCTMLNQVAGDEKNLYEIAAAEHSKAMMVVAAQGTKFDELRFSINWKRFLALRTNDVGRKLFSACHNIRPDRDLPLELQPFQAFSCNTSDFENGIVSEVNKMFGRQNRTVEVTRRILETLNKAKEALNSGLYQDAKKLYREVISLDAEEAEAHWGVFASLTENLTKAVLNVEADQSFRNALKFAPDRGSAAAYQKQAVALMGDAVWRELQRETNHLEDFQAFEKSLAAVERVYLYLPKNDSRLEQIDEYQRGCKLQAELSDLKASYESENVAAEPLFARGTEMTKRFYGTHVTMNHFTEKRALYYVMLLAGFFLVLAANILMMLHFDYERGYVTLHAKIAFGVMYVGLFVLARWLSGVLNLEKSFAWIGIALALCAALKLFCRAWARQTFLAMLAIPAIGFIAQRFYISHWYGIRKQEIGRRNEAVSAIRKIKAEIADNYAEKAQALKVRYDLPDAQIPEYVPNQQSAMERLLKDYSKKERVPSGLLYGVNTVLMLVVFVLVITFAFNTVYAAKWKNITQLAVEAYHLVGLKKDGTVVTNGYNDQGQCDTGSWKNIVQVEAGEKFTAGLTADGTVKIAAEEGSVFKQAEEWTDITALSAAQYHLVGLKADGTCVAVGENQSGECEVADFRNITEVRACDAPDGCFTLGLDSNGKVYCTPYIFGEDFVLSEFFDKHTGTGEGLDKVVKIYGNYFALLTLSDTGNLRGYGSDVKGALSEASDWDGNEFTDFYVAGFAVGVRPDGTAECAGRVPEAIAAVRTWTEVESVTGSDQHAVALRKDGTVYATGLNTSGQCNVYDWTNVKAVVAGRYNSFAILENGTVEATGYNTCGLTYTKPKNPLELLTYFVQYVTEW